ncbi:MAG: S9 family peptidase [Ignavibacteriales bacterium CG_4_9_14_3_um_filter_30_11]|nr:MAG: S9 family peptidase [Ignavibacteriales bacterium CG_4_9_14_3_um_filter_30_11]
MKSFRTISVIIILLFVSVFPQNKDLTLKQVTLKGFSLMPKNLSQLSWRENTDYFTYVNSDDKNSVLIQEGLKSTSKDTILTLDNINVSLDSEGYDKLNRFPRFNWQDENTLRFWQKNNLLTYNISTKKIERLNTIKDKGENLDLSVNNDVAYTIENNLYITKDKVNFQITKDENKGIVNGQTVHRVEFGINKGTFWSPKGNYLAYYRKDETMVTDYPIVDISQHPAKFTPIKYPMAGMTSEEVTIGIYNTNTKNTLWLNTGEPKDHYLTGVTWGPNEKYIYVGILNRDQNHLQEIKFDASTGKPVKTLFEEKNDKYVHPTHGPIFVKNNPELFLWFSERDGWDHLYLYNTNGDLLRQITKGKWEVIDFEGFEEDGNDFFITATKESPLDRNFYSVDIETGELTNITKSPGTHNVDKNSDTEYFLDSYSNLTTPLQINIVDEDGKIIKNVYNAENPLSEYKLGKTKFFSIKSKDNYELYCRMILPTNFDSTKKYPVMVYVYGGPGVQLITNRWLGGARLWDNYMASNGYIVFTLDNRGSANRGIKFEQETFRQLGTKEIEDQVTGVNYLKTLSYVDSNRMGVFGWSYGGFMTTSLMTRTPDLFKVGACGGAVIDWSYYEVMYTERYMDTPQTNSDGYKNSSLLNYVKDLKGHLLLVHGTIDPTVVWQNTLMFAEKAAHLGIALDYYPYVGHEHGVRGVDTYHLYKKVTEYFDLYLK